GILYSADVRSFPKFRNGYDASFGLVAIAFLRLTQLFLNSRERFIHREGSLRTLEALPAPARGCHSVVRCHPGMEAGNHARLLHIRAMTAQLSGRDKSPMRANALVRPIRWDQWLDCLKLL